SFENHLLTHLVIEEPEFGKLELGKPGVGKLEVDEFDIGCNYSPDFGCTGFDCYRGCFELEENYEVELD
ncbi:hypothetical protein Tco_1374573, partial [Tanacetum coccineum]